MTGLVKRITNLSVALIVAVFSVNLLTVMDVAASHNPNHNPGGNNGTLKVHEQGTPSGTESNDPKVCIFNFEGFGFDAGQDGYVVIDTQPGNVVTETLPFGPADVNGDYASAYINDGISGFTVPDGQYKATLYGKDTGNPANPDLTDEKAKSKVFKVQCPAKPTTTVQAGPCVAPGESTGIASGTVTNTDDATEAAVTNTVTATHQTT